MALLIVTVLGFMVVFSIAAMFIIHYMNDSLVSHDSETIDPKPDVRY
ncbi:MULTISPECIES: hypothetical protein [Sporosarcina]|nr:MULTISPECIES: hypothetical protein [Sporosarcina]WJY27641.1 hypothetical protein QWT68_01075 [Sporosarcina sp. 0.2-SM1T-5]